MAYIDGKEILLYGVSVTLGSLAAPTISIEGDILTIADESGRALRFEILVDGEKKATTRDRTFDLSTLSLEIDAYRITVRAMANCYMDSAESNEVVYDLRAPVSYLLDYTPSDDESYYICTGIGSETATVFKIANFIDGKPVTSIGDNAFRDSTSLTRVDLPDSIRSIGGYAFYGCTSLASVVFSDSLTSVGVYAFGNCTSLTRVDLPDSLTIIGDFMFYGCTSLASVVFSDSLTRVGQYAFCRTKLESVELPHWIDSIGMGAFYACQSLRRVIIPFFIHSIEKWAFYYCDVLEIIVFEGNLSRWNSVTKGDEWLVRSSPTYVRCEDTKVRV